MPVDTQRVLLVFQLSGETAALPIESVQRVTPMAQLARPPGLPSPLEGILNLAGQAVPVVRLDRLLQLPETRPGLYSMLIILKDVSAGPVALLVDRASRIVSLPQSALLPVRAEDSFNGCAEAVVSVQGQVVHLLSPARIFLEQERQSLSRFQTMAQQRLQDWESPPQ